MCSVFSPQHTSASTQERKTMCTWALKETQRSDRCAVSTLKHVKKCLGDTQNKRMNLKMNTIRDFSGQPPVPKKSQHFGSYNKLNIRTRRSAIKRGMKRSLGMQECCGLLFPSVQPQILHPASPKCNK